MNQRQLNEKILFGLKVKHLRLQHQLNFADFAKQTGMSVSYLNEIEKGKKYPKPDKLRLIAGALGVSEEELLHPETDKHLQPVVELLNSNFLSELPLDLFEIDLSKVVEIIANAPLKVGAFISTLVELARNYALAEEHFYLGALRSYVELHNNYFEDLEFAALEFSKKHGLEQSEKIRVYNLENLLKEEYGYTIVDDGLKDIPELHGVRAVFIPTKKKLLLAPGLTDVQKAFQFGKELGFNYLKLKARAFTSNLLRINSFEEVLSHFKASYFSCAILINQAAFVSDMRTFFNLHKWEAARLQQMLHKYLASSEMIFQRMTNVLPRFFDLDKLFLLRFVHKPSNGNYKLDTELHFSIQHQPHANALHEHYCRRWLSVGLLSDLQKLQMEGKGSGELLGVQRSRFLKTQEEYLCFTVARKAFPDEDKNVSITVGILNDETLKKNVAFVDDNRIPFRVVNTTCERCSLEDCKERAAAPKVVAERKKRKATLMALEKLLKES